KIKTAHRATAPERTPGVVAPKRRGGGFRLGIGRPDALGRQLLSRKSAARGAVAAGGLRGLRRQPPRFPGLQRNPSRLLSNSGRGPAGAPCRRGGSGGRGGGRSRCPRRSRGGGARSLPRPVGFLCQRY